MNLTIAASNGTQILLNSTDISGLPSLGAAGGYKNSIGTLVGPFNYTGVQLTTLLNLVGGITIYNSVKVIASDNYTWSLTYDEIAAGNFTTYDPITGNPVQHNQTLTPILAYYKNDVNLTSDEGPLRLAIVGPEDLLTDSKFWIKWVARLEVVGATPEHDVAVTSIVPYKTVVGEGNCVNTTVTVANWGNNPETFNVTAYDNTSAIASFNLTFGSGASRNITFLWNTSGIAHGNYSLSAFAAPVIGETNIANNNLTGRWVTVAGEGDLTGGTTNGLDFMPDGQVNMKDVGVVARFFMQPIPPAPSNCDITGTSTGVPDGLINMRDVGAVAKHFGEHYP